jgi:hypothetical protein
MFLTAAFYFYVADKRKLTIVMLGLGAATHVVVMVIAVLWLVSEVLSGRGKVWLRYVPLFVICGVLPYALTIWELNNTDPQFIAGGPVSMSVINNYLGSTGVVGTLAVTSLPDRLWHFAGFIIVSLGVALVPMVVGMKQKQTMKGWWLAIIALGFVSWYYLTCLDPTTWHYLPWVMPFAAIMAGVGIGKMTWMYTARLVAVGAGCLVLANAVFLNAGIETARNPQAQIFYSDVMAIPDGSAVVINRGGGEGLGFQYALASGKQLIPIYLQYDDNLDTPLYRNYAVWMAKKYGMIDAVNGSRANIAEAESKGIPVYTLKNLVQAWDAVIQQEPFNQDFGRVVGVNNQYPVTSNLQWVKVGKVK